MSENTIFHRLSRRDFLKTLLTGGAMFGATAATRFGLEEMKAKPAKSLSENELQQTSHGHHGSMGTVGQVDPASSGIDPQEFLSDFDYGEVSELENGQTLREYNIVAVDREIEIAPGVFFPAWTYNGRVPGPNIRCVEGDRIRERCAGLRAAIERPAFHPRLRILRRAAPITTERGPGPLTLPHRKECPWKS